MIETLLKFVVAPVAVVLQLLLQRGGVLARLRSRARASIELRNQLPDTSEAREVLDGHIDNLVLYYIGLETQQLVKVRDWSQIIINTVMIGGFGYLTWYLVRRDTWWGWVLGAVVGVLVFGLVGTTTTELRGKTPEESKHPEPLPGQSAPTTHGRDDGQVEASSSHGAPVVPPENAEQPSATPDQ